MTCPVEFTVESVDRSSGARAAVLKLGRGTIRTPVFMPVGTQAAIRAMPPLFLSEIKTQIILANTYHLHQRPGEEIVAKLGGLHRFMGVDLPILTDSGGFQVFSLDKKEITEEGVAFSYEVDGKPTVLSPEVSMAIQQKLGSDIAMAFDECLPPDASRARTETSVDMTARWAERCVKAHDRPDQSLFGIVQGGMFPDLRQRSVSQITSLGFDGYAIGGLSVGEGPELMNRVLAETTPHMPAHLPRYLMGVGRPQDLVDGVALGVDMFDCVIPTRHARSGTLYTFQGRIRITHNRYRRDAYPIDTTCPCYTCRHFSRAYLHHLFSVGEVLGATLCTIHNLTFFQELMTNLRQSIVDGRFASFRKDIKALYPETGEAAGVERDEVDAEKRQAASRQAQTRQVERPKRMPAPEPRAAGRAASRAGDRGEARPSKSASRGGGGRSSGGAPARKGGGRKKG